jgi:hypothetical protein
MSVIQHDEYQTDLHNEHFSPDHSQTPPQFFARTTIPQAPQPQSIVALDAADRAPEAGDNGVSNPPPAPPNLLPEP